MPNKVAQFVRLLRSTGRERRLGTVIFFVTSRCNAKCETCFYHEELNRPGDLTFEQIERVSRTMPGITDLWLSGGEPTLRPEVDDVLSLHPGLDLYLNVALDGYGETHDRVRGVPGNWGRTLDCIRALYPLKEKYGDRFRLNVNTVVCAENYAEVGRLADFMWGNFRLDGHYFNVVRGETKAGAGIKQIPAEVLPEMYARVAALTKRYGGRMFAGDDAATRFVKSVAYVGAITTHYRTQHANFAGASAWPFPCTAGETTAVIDYNGDVRACELRGKFASLPDFDYDFGKLWEAEGRRAELASIDGGRACWCTHVCFIHDSMRHSRRAQLWDVPVNYLTRNRW